MKKCRNCGAEMSEFDRLCPHCGADNEEPETEIREEPRPDPAAYPMRWHKFLMVVMIIGAVLNAISGIRVASGSVNGEYYGEFPGLQGCDRFCGFATIILAVFQLYTRNSLNAFRKEGPALITILYAAGLAINVIYMLMASAAIPGSIGELFDLSNVSPLLLSLVMLTANYIYYKKRKALFVN